ncbi:MAG: hypothetical protein HWE14_02280 [Flavobacteriia bacterium]|nr:hypothetical protein [Flavobacteriia bacterium]
MRIAEQIPHATFRIVIYVTDKHFMVELEAGPMRQSYRYAKEVYPSVESVKATLTNEWLDKVHDHFNAMYGDWKGLALKS